MDYEEFTETTDISDHDLQFYLDGMSEEHGELFGVFKRMRRGDYGEEIKKQFKQGFPLYQIIHTNHDILIDIFKELGDHHWYETRFIQELGYSWKDVEELNMNKLDKRIETKTLMGKGDNRENGDSV